MKRFLHPLSTASAGTLPARTARKPTNGHPRMGRDRGTWSGTVPFVLAAAGSAVGLGNIWKFPYIAGENGGGAFVLVYLLCIALVGLPLLTAEMLLGRSSRKEPVGTYAALAGTRRKGKLWSLFGWLAVGTAFVLLGYYSVVGGWTLAYAVQALGGSFSAANVETIPGRFAEFVGNGSSVIFYHGLFMAITMAIVLGGVKGGIERAGKVLMPLLALLLGVLLVRSLMMEKSSEAIRFLFYPDFSRLTPAGVLEALGHSFFTLSLGMGAMIVYGSYQRKQDGVFSASLAVAVLDTAVALVAGVMIFGIVFSFGLQPGAGPSLIFETMPMLFAQMAGGTVFAVLFFLLVAFAAITSAISILEVVVAYFVDELRMSRRLATLAFGAVIFVVGIPAALSFGPLGDVKLLGERGVFDTMDYLVSNWALPLGGLGVALFAGWVVSKGTIKRELDQDRLGRVLFTFWRLTTRFVAPAAIVLVVLHSLHVL